MKEKKNRGKNYTHRCCGALLLRARVWPAKRPITSTQQKYIGILHMWIRARGTFGCGCAPQPRRDDPRAQWIFHTQDTRFTHAHTIACAHNLINAPSDNFHNRNISFSAYCDVVIGYRLAHRWTRSLSGLRAWAKGKEEKMPRQM